MESVPTDPYIIFCSDWPGAGWSNDKQNTGVTISKAETAVTEKIRSNTEQNPQETQVLWNKSKSKLSQGAEKKCIRWEMEHTNTNVNQMCYKINTFKEPNTE